MSDAEESVARARGGDPSGAFLGDDAGAEAYRDAVDRAAAAAVELAGADDPYSGATYREQVERLADRDCIPDEGVGLDAALDEAAEEVLADAVVTSHPTCVAHLQCPPTVPALAAELLLTALNQSLDSWDQAPAATVLEERIVADLASLFGFGPRADGVFTSGGTGSNRLGLLLARERALDRLFDRDGTAEGLPPEASGLRVLCSEAAHFTAAQVAGELGLGERAVVEVPTDEGYRMDPAALDATLDRLDAEGGRPFALVGTAGTTDFGSVDPLDALADRAEEWNLWYHVDAAYGGALALSDVHRRKLSGVERADSVAVDFHKLFYQPISCGALLLRDGREFERIARDVAYLDPENSGAPNLVAKSLQTTRRFDALKPYVTFRALGRRRLAGFVESTIDLAAAAAERIRADPAFELACEPALNAVVFRYAPVADHPSLDAGAWSDRLNEGVRNLLVRRGRAVVARTEVDGRTHLKFTLLNPRTTRSDVAGVLLSAKRYGAALEADDGAVDGDGPVELGAYE